MPLLVPLVKKLASLTSTLSALLGCIAVHIMCGFTIANATDDDAPKWNILRLPLLKLPIVMAGVTLGHLIIQDHLKLTQWPEWTKYNWHPKLKWVIGDLFFALAAFATWSPPKTDGDNGKYSTLNTFVFLPTQLVCLCAWLFSLTHRSGITGTILRCAPLTFTGAVVYPLYLFHINVIMSIPHREAVADYTVVFLAAFSLCIVAAYLIQEYIFKPVIMDRLMPWGQQLIKKQAFLLAASEDELLGLLPRLDTKMQAAANIL